VWSLLRRLRRVLLDTLMAGDGDFSSKQYYTASEQLRNDVCRLAMSLVIKPRYFSNGDDLVVSLNPSRPTAITSVSLRRIIRSCCPAGTGDSSSSVLVR